LNKNKKIKTIIIYGKLNSQPLLSLSQDDSQWNEVESMDTEGSYTTPLRIDFRQPRVARYVKITPVHSDLEIDEVEIYKDGN